MPKTDDQRAAPVVHAVDLCAGDGHGRTEAGGPVARGPAVQALQPSHGADLLPLGQAIHLLPRCTPPCRDGWGGNQRLSDASGRQAEGQCFDPEPGPCCPVVPLSSSNRARSGRFGRGRPRPQAQTPIRITRPAKCPTQIPPYDMQGLGMIGQGCPEVSYTGRNKERRILCGYI